MKRKILCIFLVLFSLNSFSQESKATKKKVSAQRQTLISYALAHQGKPFVMGAVGPNSFDCSGFVGYVMNYGLGVQLPRTAQAIYNSKKVKIISSKEKEPGDLVFFKDTKINPNKFTHVGIYCGIYHNSKNPNTRFEGKRVFISAISDGPRTGVQLELMDARYWKNHLYAYGRVLPKTEEYNSSLKKK